MIPVTDGGPDMDAIAEILERQLNKQTKDLTQHLDNKAAVLAKEISDLRAQVQIQNGRVRKLEDWVLLAKRDIKALFAKLLVKRRGEDRVITYGTVTIFIAGGGAVFAALKLLPWIASHIKP